MCKTRDALTGLNAIERKLERPCAGCVGKERMECASCEVRAALDGAAAVREHVMERGCVR